jgi:hypothetical protein
MPGVLIRHGLGAALLASVALIPLPARAQKDDAPIPYPDDEPPRELPRNSRPSYTDKEVPVEKEDRAKLLGRFDDPSIGFAAELIAGAMLISSSRGQGGDPSFAYGARATWEWGRLLPDEFFHEALFVDFSWAYAGLADGTQQISGNSNFHYFTIAPAFFLPFGAKSPYGLYAQLGGGVAYQADSIHYEGAVTDVSGIRPLFQYGVGFRGRPPINEDGTIRLCFRVELTRFRRSYMDDTFIAGAVGVDF